MRSSRPPLVDLNADLGEEVTDDAGLLGGLVSTLVYAALCLLYEALLPGVFRRVWHTERFVGRFVLGLPLEELLYGWAAGAAASAFVPYAFDLRLVRRAPGAPAATAPPA